MNIETIIITSFLTALPIVLVSRHLMLQRVRGFYKEQYDRIEAQRLQFYPLAESNSKELKRKLYEFCRKQARQLVGTLQDTP